METKQAEWAKKLNEWYDKGYPINYAICAYLENKEKSFQEICDIIEKEKIPEYNKRIESLSKLYQS